MHVHDVRSNVGLDRVEMHVHDGRSNVGLDRVEGTCT